MSEKGALKNKKIEVIALVILAAFIVALGFLVYRYNKNKDFIYEKHLQENVITINSENITLKDFSYYVYVVEKKIILMMLMNFGIHILRIHLTVCLQGIMLNNWR